MKCLVCGTETKTKYCNECSRIISELMQIVGEEQWGSIEDFSHIYPMVKRVRDGELTVRDLVQSMEVED